MRGREGIERTERDFVQLVPGAVDDGQALPLDEGEVILADAALTRRAQDDAGKHDAQPELLHQALRLQNNYVIVDITAAIVMLVSL